MNELKRLPEENEEQYLWRVGSLIDSGKYKNWGSVANIVNSEMGLPKEKYRTESAFRKQYQAAKKFYKNVFSKFNNDDYYKELKEQERKLYKERKKLSTIKLEYNREDTIKARRELFYENIGRNIKRLKQPEIINEKPCVSSDISNMEYILAISDIHYGAQFQSVNNQYDTQECKYRFNILLDKVSMFIREHNLQEITIVNLGDDIQGILRMSDIALNEQPVVRSIVEVANLIARFLNKLSAYCKIKYYHVPYANHTQTRPLGSKANVLSAEDVTFVITNYIKDILHDNKRVSVNLAEDNKRFIEFEINGFKFIASHGHDIKNIEQFQNKFSFINGKKYDYFICGHLHNRQLFNIGEGIFHDCETLICPSFIGSDPYSDSLLEGSKAACMIYGFHPIEGHIEDYKLILN